MDQPIYWSGLTAVVAVAVLLRWWARPVLRGSRGVRLRRWEWAVAAVSVAGLSFHCGAMFFPDWVDVVPGLTGPAASVRALDGGSRWAYALPALGLVLSVRRTWWPGLVVLATTLTGVGVTMYQPYPLDVHLGWLAAAVVAASAIIAILTTAGPELRSADEAAV